MVLAYPSIEESVVSRVYEKTVLPIVDNIADNCLISDNILIPSLVVSHNLSVMTTSITSALAVDVPVSFVLSDNAAVIFNQDDFWTVHECKDSKAVTNKSILPTFDSALTGIERYTT